LPHVQKRRIAQNKLAVSTPAYYYPVCIRLYSGAFAMHCLPWQWKTANVCFDRRWACQRHHRTWAAIYRVLSQALRASSKGKDQQGFCDDLQEIAWYTNQRLSRYAIRYEPSTAPIAAGPITWAKPCAAGQHSKSSHQVLLEDVLRTPRSGSGADLWAPVLDERHGTSLVSRCDW